MRVLGRNMAFLIRAIAREREAAGLPETEPQRIAKILSDNKMDDKSQIEALYKQMYRAMVEKDTVTLDEQHADEFVLTHMKTMGTEGPLEALQMGLAFYRSHRISIKGLIHHSDRGSQYASSMYTDLLKAIKIRISMTQCGDPLHNAMAERVNNIVKNEWPGRTAHFR